MSKKHKQVKDYYDSYSKIDQFKEFSSTDNSGVNSRLQACLNVVKQIDLYAIKHDIKHIVFGGDLFHTRPAVDTLTYNLTMGALIDLSLDKSLYIISHKILN